MSQSNASNNIYKKYCSVFQQDTSMSASQEISDRYHEIKQNNENNILNSSRIASQDNKSSSVNNANLKIVIDKIVDSVTRMESSSSGIQNEKSSPMVNFNTKEFVSFNHFNDDTFEDDDGNVLDTSLSQTNIIDEVKTESQWGSDTQFAALVDKEAAILNLVNSKDMAQENMETPHTTNTIKSLSNEKTDCAKYVIDANQIYNINSHTENNNSRKFKNVEETELVLSSTVLSDFNSTFCEATQPTYSQNELEVISNHDLRNVIQNICVSEQNRHTSQSKDEEIDCAEVVDDMNQRNINGDTENNTSHDCVKNIEETELVLSSTILSDFNSPFCEVTQTSDSQNESDFISNDDLRNELQNTSIPQQDHSTFPKDVNELPSQILFKVPNPVFKSPRRKHRYIDTCFKDDLSHSIFKSDHIDGTFKASVSHESVHHISDAASRKGKKVFESIDSHDNTNTLQINALESVMTDKECPHFEKANDGSQIISSSVMDTQDFSIKDLDLIFDQEMKTLNRNCENPFPVGSSKGLDFTTASNKPMMVSKVALFNAKKMFEGIDNIPDNIQTFDTSYCIEERGLKANKIVGTIEDGNRFSVIETEGIKNISPEDALSQKELSTKGIITDLKQCLDSSSSQTLEDQTEHHIARTINETYTVESDTTDINNASKANTNGSDDILGGSTSTVPIDNIGKISVELEHWEEFFNCTLESVNNGSEANISEEENDDSNASLSPVIVSQRSKVKIGRLAKNIIKKQNTRRNCNLDSCDGSLEMSDNIKLTAVNKKLFSSARKLDLLEADGGAETFVLKDEAKQTNPENNILPGECLDRIHEDFGPTSVLENLSKSCGGFVFASTKSVEVSDAALKKGKSVFEGVDEDANELITFDNNEESVYEGISTASCKTETVILTQHPFNVFEIEDENKILFSKNNYADNANEGSTSNTVGLKTGKDNAMTVSEKAVVVDMDEDIMAMVEDIDKDIMTVVKDIDKDVMTVVEDIDKRIKSVVEDIEKDALVVLTITDKNTKGVIPDTDGFDEMIPEELLELGNSLESTAFNTSNNKSITLSEKVPTKTKGQVLSLEETATELVEQNQTRLHIDATGDNNYLCDKESFKMDFFEQKSCFKGFSLASHKPCEISKKGLEFAKNMFKDDLNKSDLDAIENFENNVKFIEPCQFSKHSNSQNKLQATVSKETLSRVKDIFVDVEKDTNDLFKGYNDLTESTVPITLEKGSTSESSKFSRLSTANNKVVPVLDNAKVRDFVKDVVNIDTEHMKEPTVSCPKLSVCNTGNQKPTHVSKEALAVIRNGVFKNDLEIENLDEPTDAYTNFPGFSAGNQKPIHVSKEALDIGRRIFKDVDSETENLVEPTVSYPKFPGFSTGNQKPIFVSKEALDIGRRIFKDVDSETGNLDEPTVSYPNFPGFSTGNQKPIHVSKEALNIGRCIFKDVDSEKENLDEPTDSYPKFPGFSTGNQKPIHVSKEALDIGRRIFKDVDSETGNLDEATVSYPNFPGFSTGNQKPIHVSKEALDIGRRIFKDVDSETGNLDEPTDSYPKFPGFSTGNQKPILVSKEALDIGRRIFKDVDSEKENLDEPTVSYPKFPGFSTGNEKPIFVSKEALDIGRRIFKDVDSEKENLDEPTVSYPKFPGFSTGNQKPIHVSKEALDIGRRIFKDVDSDKENLVEPRVSYPKFPGFSTGNQKPIHVSKEALAFGRNMFKDVDSKTGNLDEPKVLYPEFPGFGTVNQKPIDVSKEALAIGRKNFKGVDSETENLIEAKKKSLCEFSAGNEKDVVVQEQALSEAKILTVRKDRYIDPNKKINNDISKAVTGFEEVTEVEMVIPDKPRVSKEEFANKNAIGGCTSNSEFKTLKRKRPVSPDRFNNKDNLNPNNFLLENLTQEISESAMALMNDEKENFSTNFEKVNCSSNIDVDEAPLSPILPCRWKNRAKKTFKAPYKSQIVNDDKVSSHVLKKVKYTDKIDILEIENKVRLTEESLNDLKETKDMDLGDLLNSKLNRGVNKIILSSIKTVNSKVSEDVLNISPDNFDNFVFTNERLDIKTGIKAKDLTVKDLVSLFFEHKDVDSKLIPEGWILNGIKWIIWKLASYERFYGEMFRNVLSASAVLMQLKYRYDKELYKAERPILRKILEMDDAPGRKMILCVSRIIKSPVVISEKTITTGKIPPAYELEVTDGWYGVLATIDNVLCSYISKKKLQVGTKLIVCGSELLNCGQGKTPLEDISAVRLRLHGNGVRRAPHFSRLGPCPNGTPLRLAVDTLEQGAGPTPTLRIKPIVVYPLQHYEKLPNGSTVTRSDRMETLESSRQQLALQARAECLYAQAEEEVLSEVQRERSKGRGARGGPADSQDSEDLAQQMDMAIDPVEFLNNLSNSQRRKLETAMSERNESIRQQIESRVSELLNGDGETSSSRRVVSMLKVRALVLETIGGCHRVTPVMLTVWKPSDCTEQMLQVKDIVLDMYKAVPTGLKAGEINLSANKTTVFKEVTNKKTVDKFTKQMEEYKRTCTSIRDANQPSFSPLFKEVDTVGLIFHIEPSVMDNTKQYVQTVYLADQDMNFVAINFWGGIHKFGFEKCIEIGKILACCNLKYRTASRKRIRNLYASEFSTFTQCPKKAYMQEFLKEFENAMKLINFKEYAEKCRRFLNDMNNSLSMANISRLQNVSSTSKAGIVFDRSNNSTNGLSKMSLNENSLSGLDFDSTFAENSSVSKSPSDAERRIKRLKMYGEPPPLAALVLNVSSNIKKDFIAPSIDTSLRKENCPENDTNSKNEDHFREEFEYSPPLSLD